MHLSSNRANFCSKSPFYKSVQGVNLESSGDLEKFKREILRVLHRYGVSLDDIKLHSGLPACHEDARRECLERPRPLQWAHVGIVVGVFVAAVVAWTWDYQLIDLI